MSDGGDGRKRAKREHAASGKKPHAAASRDYPHRLPPGAPRRPRTPSAPSAAAQARLSAPPLYSEPEAASRTAHCSSACCAAVVAVMVATVSVFCARGLVHHLDLPEHTLVVSAVIVQRSLQGIPLVQELSPQRLTRDDGGKNDLSCFGFWEVWCRVTGRKGLRKARNLV
ncbi:hypothetical protein EDB86DRAFT_2824387 [Lactarius hatsudake]|nr:hypothetical protein EDB86DRAFT_2824387 [Lactarius hatsudake]